MNHSDYGPIGLLVIQSTSLCNLDCSYCYLPDRQRRNIFDLEQQLLCCSIGFMKVRSGVPPVNPLARR